MIKSYQDLGEWVIEPSTECSSTISITPTTPGALQLE